MEELNNEAFKLIELLKSAPEDLDHNKTNHEGGLIGSRPIINLGVVENLKKYKYDGYGNVLSAYASLKSGYVGFSELEYPRLRELAFKICQVSPFEKLTDSKFIESEIFTWILNVYENKKAEKDLLGYLFDRIDEELDGYIFYFKIQALGIESEFKIGNVTIGNLTKEKIEKEKRMFLLSGKSEAEIENFFSEFSDIPLAIVNVKGIKSRAKSIAIKEVGLAIDCLKSCLIRESLNISYQMLEIDIRGFLPGISSYLCETTQEKFDFLLCLSQPAGAQPIIVDRERLDELQKGGLTVLSNFLIRHKKTELNNMILWSIKTMSNINSLRNLHERIIKIISLFETIIIPENNLQAKGLNLIKKDILPSLRYLKHEREFHARIFNSCYNIRDRYLHNGQELFIHLQDLHEFQKCALLFILHLCELSKSNDTLRGIQLWYKNNSLKVK